MPSSEQAAVYAPVESGFAQGTPVGIPLHRQRDENGVVPQSRRRRKWWFQSGPMETWSFFLTLRSGVAWTGFLVFIFGCSALKFYLAVPGALATLEDQYAEVCDEPATKPFSCAKKAEDIKHLEDISGHLFLSITFDVIPSLVPGTIGLAAAYRRDPRLVKLFLWSYLTRCLIQYGWLIGAIAIGSYAIGEDLEKISWAEMAWVELFFVYIDMYILKGIWSYQMQLLRRRDAATQLSSATPARSEIELDSQPLV
ncbi:unnamed protein product [Scytosiphon promiscuus]